MEAAQEGGKLKGDMAAKKGFFKKALQGSNARRTELQLLERTEEKRFRPDQGQFRGKSMFFISKIKQNEIT